MITPIRNSHGNLEYEAHSVHRVETVRFLTQSAAQFWLDIVEEVAKCRWQRGVK